jgi:YD repeat-containing protein
MNDAHRVLYRSVTVTDVYPHNGDPNGGETVRVFGSGFVPGQTTVTFGAAAAQTTYVSSTELLVTTPAGALGTTVIAVTTPAGTATLRDAFNYVPPFVAVSVTPAESVLRDQTVQLTATGVLSGGGTTDLTTRVAWSSSDASIAVADVAGLVRAVKPGTVTITAAFGSLSGTATITVRDPNAIPPDPSSIAPPLRDDVTTSFAGATEFLYSGPAAIQRDVRPGAIAPNHVCVVRGKVISRDGAPLPGTRVSAPAFPEVGYAVARADGAFDFAVNGGGTISLRYEQVGYFPAQRDARTRWNAFIDTPTVALVAADPVVTTIAAGAPSAQIARGTRVEDKDGARQATLIYPAGVEATMTLPTGETRSLTSFAVRATEYTVGPNGLKAMPAQLPPNSGYTYAVEFSADEAIATGATTVRFSKPIATYVENFIGFPVGMAVPTGYYDRERNAWIASENGRVVRILSVSGGSAVLDVTGRNTPATDAELAALGIDGEELSRLATLYTPGQSLWRVRVTHFTPWDHNWPYGPPAGAQAPNTLSQPINLRRSTRGCLIPQMSVIDCQNHTLGETISIAGTGMALQYQSDRTPGFTASRMFTVKVTASQVPQGLKRVELEIAVAGRLFTETFTPRANIEYPFVWDGRDVYGRAVHGNQLAHIRIGNVYDAVYQTPAELDRAFASYSGIGITGIPARQEVVLWQEQEVTLEPWSRPWGAVSGWSLSAHHSYDPAASMLYLGDGSRRHADASEDVLSTVSGAGCLYSGRGHTGDGGPAKDALLSLPWSLASAPDGSLYVMTGGDDAIRKIDPSGVITTIAGSNGPGYNGDEIPATSAQLNHLESHIVVRNGIIYFLDRFNYRVRTITPDGIIHTIAGNGDHRFGGDGGPATKAGMEPVGIDVASDGTIYFTDWSSSTGFTQEFRLRRITPDGQIDTIAGGLAGFAGDGGPVAAAKFRRLDSVRIAPDGSIYLADAYNYRIRRITPDGIIRTFAGTSFGFSGDGGPATSARLNAPIDVAFGNDGSVYITDFGNSRVRRVSPDGIISTVAGSGNRSCDEGLPALRNAIVEPAGIVVDGRGTVYFADSGNHRLRKFLDRSLAVKSGKQEGELLVASEDGGQVYGFDVQGRHLRTIDARTKSTLLTFSYDPEGRLTSITDIDDQATALERDGSGAVQAIVAPGGQRTIVMTTKDGWLESITAPGNLADRFEYSATGLLLSHTNPRQFTSVFEYAADGRLKRDSDPAGGFQQVSLTETPTQRTSLLTSAMGRVRRYVSNSRTASRARSSRPGAE